MLKAGVRPTVRVTRGSPTSGRPVPSDYAEAVEQWARNHGGHATLKWLRAPMNCWAVILSYRVNDPRLQDPTAEGEKVLLHDYKPAQWWARHAPNRARRHYRTNAIMHGHYAYELDELGVEGIIQRLDKGNILSGRGEFQSVEHTADVASENHRTFVDRTKASARDDAGARARDVRRKVYKIPFLGVGVSFGKDGSIEGQESTEVNQVRESA